MLGDVEVGPGRSRIDGGVPGGRGARPVHGQRPLLAQTSDHVEVDHVAHPIQGHGRVLDKKLRAVQAEFLAREGDEEDVACRGFGRPELAGDLEEGRHAGGVVVGAVVDERVAGLERAGPAVAQVVVVGADNDGPLGAIVEEADDVAPAARLARVGGVGVRAEAEAEGLEVASVRPRLEPELLKPLGDVVGGEGLARRPGRAPFEQVGREVGDVDAEVVQGPLVRRIRRALLGKGDAGAEEASQGEEQRPGPARLAFVHD